MPATNLADLQLVDDVLTNLALQYRTTGFVYDDVVLSRTHVVNGCALPL